MKTVCGFRVLVSRSVVGYTTTNHQPPVTIKCALLRYGRKAVGSIFHNPFSYGQNQYYAFGCNRHDACMQLLQQPGRQRGAVSYPQAVHAVVVVLVANRRQGRARAAGLAARPRVWRCRSCLDLPDGAGLQCTPPRIPLAAMGLACELRQACGRLAGAGVRLHFRHPVAFQRCGPARRRPDAQLLRQCWTRPSQLHVGLSPRGTHPQPPGQGGFPSLCRQDGPRSREGLQGVAVGSVRRLVGGGDSLPLDYRLRRDFPRRTRL